MKSIAGLVFPLLLSGLAVAEAQVLGTETVVERVPMSPQNEKMLTREVEARSLYRAFCASCHGASGEGDGPAAQALNPGVADLTRIAQRNGGEFPAIRVMNVIDGTRAAHRSSREMPLWGAVFRQTSSAGISRLRVYNLAKYVESLQKPSPEAAEMIAGAE